MAPRYGIAHVQGLYPISSEFLTASPNAANELFGLTGEKLFMAPTYALLYPNQTGFGSPTNLTQLAQSTPFASVFSNPDVTDFYLNCWTFANGVANPWVNGTANLDAEETEIYNLVVHLRNTYPGKRFVLQCWEGDWSLLGDFDAGGPAPHERHQAMVAFYKRWRKAVNEAMAATTGTCEVTFAIEINRTLDPAVDRVWYKILGAIQPDAISLSLYEAINTWGSGQAEAEAYIETLMVRLFKKLQTVLPKVRIYLGEFGWPENFTGFTSIGLNAGDLLQKVIDISTNLGYTDVIYWNLFDNTEEPPGTLRGYYLIKPDASFSQAAGKFLEIGSKIDANSWLAPHQATFAQYVGVDFSNATWIDRESAFNATEVGSVLKAFVPIATRFDALYGFSVANYFTLPATSAFEMTATTQRTIELVVRADDGIIFGRYNAPFGGALELAIVGVFIATIYDDTGGGAYRFVSGATTLVPGNYYHLALTVDSLGDVVKIYVNGIEDGSSSGTAGSLTPGTPQQYWIGNSNGNNFPFAGRIAELCFTESVLSSNEIKKRADFFNFFRGY